MKEIKDYNKKQSGIYRIVNLINNNFYIGSSNNLYIRQIHHFTGLRNKKHFNIYLQNAVDKYGLENFKFEILSTCPPEYLIQLEQWFINNLKPTYNILREVVNSQLGLKWRQESKDKLSKSKTIGPIYEYDLAGFFVKEWKSVEEIVNVLKYTPSVVRYVLNGKINKCKISIFKYEKLDRISPYNSKKINKGKKQIIYKKDKKGVILKTYSGLKECSIDLGISRNTISAALFYNSFKSKDYILEKEVSYA